jgi:hypothetical protein
LNLPGSLKAATENLRAVLPALPHAVKMLRGETAHHEQDKERLISINSTGEPKDLRPAPSTARS